jgi:hypothetical protein
MKNRNTKVKQVLFWIMRSAFLSAVFAGVPGGQLHAGDQLLKEYIYLDGRLLAVERQVIPAIATTAPSPAGKADQVPQLEAINNWSLMSDDAIPFQLSADSSDSVGSEKAAMRDRQDARQTVALRQKPEKEEPIND